MKKWISVFTAALLLSVFALPHAADAKRARVAKDPDAPTNEEAKVLGWGPVKTPNRGKNAEFMIRGVVLEVEDAKGPDGKKLAKKDFYDVKILPIEVLNNHQRVITMEDFKNGIDLTLFIPKPKIDELKKGRMVEYNQYYTESVEQAIGGAKMIAMTLHKDIQGYPAGPGAYLKTPGFYPIQYKNALKGVKLYLSSIKSDKEVQALVDHLATKSEDPELQTIAKNTYMEVWTTIPTGKCKLDKVDNRYECPE